MSLCFQNVWLKTKAVGEESLTEKPWPQNKHNFTTGLAYTVIPLRISHFFKIFVHFCAVVVQEWCESVTTLQLGGCFIYPYP